MKKRISKRLIEKGLEEHEIVLGMQDDLLAAHIGNFWFYISSEPDKTEQDFTKNELVEMIWTTINDEPINDNADIYATECLYYKALLEERLKP